MALELLDTLEKKEGKQLYDYQKKAIDQIFERLRSNGKNYNLLYQLPTGGGKTVIFSEIAKQYIHENKRKVLILTHRIELCRQTSSMLGEFAVKNKIIDSQVKDLPNHKDYDCFVAMVETLNNRLTEEKINLEDVGLVIIDEAHYNSFRKMFKFFESMLILGVTATPLSSNIKLPMRETYDELIVGDSISKLIGKGFLSKATTYSYDVGLQSLKVGASGDYTVRSSELLYTNFIMQEKLLYAYQEKALGKKTLIFNNGINTSKHVQAMFTEAGYEVKHLDNTNTAQERKEILEWFRTKPNAILTSVSILTTGFDEPSVQTIFINRATKSLTLYHQMIGRGSRVLPTKKEFDVIDLGNNARRFGLWEEYVDWHSIFVAPHAYLENLVTDEEIERNFVYVMPNDLREKFKKSKDIDFDVPATYDRVVKSGSRPKETIELSIEQHSKMCIENSDDMIDALDLIKVLDNEIEYRIRRYSYCLAKSTDNYIEWLKEEYIRKLRNTITQHF